jgi:hypothetical protein
MKLIPELQGWQELHRYVGLISSLDSRIIFFSEYVHEDIFDARNFQYLSCF